MAANHYAFMRREIRRQVRRELAEAAWLRRQKAKMAGMIGGALLACVAVGGLIGWAGAHGLYAIFG